MRSMTPSTAWFEVKVFSERVNLALALDVDLVGVVHHDLADLLVGEEGLERPEAERLVEHVGEQLLAIDVRRELLVRLHLVDDVADRLLGAAPQLLVAEPVHVQPAQVEVLDQPVVDVLLQPRVALQPRVDALALLLALERGGHRRRHACPGPSCRRLRRAGDVRRDARVGTSCGGGSGSGSVALFVVGSGLLVVLLLRRRRRTSSSPSSSADGSSLGSASPGGVPPSAGAARR